nr:DUF6709 family protein [uncultured Acetatifactor sp.]
MVGKLTLKYWMSILLFCLICLALSAPFWKYGPAALEALQGGTPELAESESMSNIYGLAGLGLFFLLIVVALIIRGLTNSVGKRARKYLEGHSGVTMEQLDTDFAAAEKVGNIWVGKSWIYSHDLNCLLVGNDIVVLVYGETERSRNRVNYYLCLGLKDGSVERVRVSESNLSRIQEIYERYSHIVVGNNPEYKYMFKNDRDAFLNIKYRRNME